MQHILSIGIFQAVLIIALLWKDRLRNSADYLLVFLLGCIAVHFAIKVFIFNCVTDVQVRSQMNTFVGFCYAPLLYLYAIKARLPQFVPASKWFVFLPFVLGAIGYFTVAGVLYYSSGAGYGLLAHYNQASFWMLIACDILFSGLALLELKKYGTALKGEQLLVKRISACFLFLVVISVPVYLFANGAGKGFAIVFRSIAYSILAGVGVMILRHKYVAASSNQHPVVYKVVSEELPTPQKIVGALAAGTQLEEHAGYGAEIPEVSIRKNLLAEAEQKKILARLEQYLAESKIFVDSELTLDKLALATGINKYHISETLNGFAGKSFYQYINEYRINYALSNMRRLQQQSIAINVLTIAYDAGFKAKSSFNRYFKEMIGTTPTEYMRSLKELA